MVETHLLDFDGDLYGETLATDLLERIRPDARFDSIEDLIAQMRIDKAQARDMLATQGDRVVMRVIGGSSLRVGRRGSINRSHRSAIQARYILTPAVLAVWPSGRLADLLTDFSTSRLLDSS